MRGAVIGGAVILALAAGWFTMSHVAMKTPVSDALGEALGVALGLLMLASVVGALRSARRERTSPGGGAAHLNGSQGSPENSPH